MALSSAAARPRDPRPDPAVSWRRNLLFVWIGVFVGLVGANFVFPFMPFYIQKLGISDTGQVSFYSGLSEGATGLSLTLTAPLWGAIADRFGRRPMFLRALLGAGILIGLMGIVINVWQLIALRFLMGAFAGTMGAAAALVAATTPREKVGRALGTLQTAAFSSNMLGPVLGGFVAANLGIRESFLFCAILYGLAVVLVVVFVKEGTDAGVAAPTPASASQGVIGDLRAVVAERQIVVMLILTFILWLGTTFVRPVLPLNINSFSDFANSSGAVRVTFNLGFWSARLNAEAATGIVFGVIGLTSTVAALSLGPLGDRFGYRLCVSVAAVASGLLYLPVALTGTFMAFLGLMGVVGLFQGAMVPGLNALIAAAVPDGKQGSAFGLAASMQSLALLVGPFSGGLAGGIFGINAPYVIIGIVLAVTGVWAYLAVRDPVAHAPRVIGLADH